MWARFTPAPTLGTGDPAFLGVQPAWEERTNPVNANNLFSYTSSGETETSLKVSRAESSLQLTTYEAGL